MKIIVTGGAGFIGSHLSKLLMKENDVLIVDDLSTGNSLNIDKIVMSNKVKFVKESILNQKIMKQYIIDCDTIFHLAAAVGVDYVIKNPNKIKEVNLDGSEVIFTLASKHKKAVFFSSSSEVYSNLLKGDLKECQEQFHLNEISHYGKSKRDCENLAEYYCKSKNLKIVVARYFNTIGPNQSSKYGMVVPRFIRQAIREEPITIYGDGKQTRSFIDVRDLVVATIMLMNNEKSFGQTINIGNDHEISINYLANLIKTYSHSKSKVIMVPYKNTIRKDYINSTKRKPNINKIKQLLNWEPKFNLTDSILNIIQKYNAE